MVLGFLLREPLNPGSSESAPLRRRQPPPVPGFKGWIMSDWWALHSFAAAEGRSTRKSRAGGSRGEGGLNIRWLQVSSCQAHGISRWCLPSWHRLLGGYKMLAVTGCQVWSLSLSITALILSLGPRGVGVPSHLRCHMRVHS